MFHPSGEAWRFIVQEDTPIGYGRFSVRILPRFDIHILLFLDRNICPPIPGGYSYLFGEFIDTVDSTASVTADDNHCFFHSLAWIGDDLQDVFFVFSTQFLRLILPVAISFLIKGVLIVPAMIHRAGTCTCQKLGFRSAYLQYVLPEIAGSCHYPFVFGRVYIYRTRNPIGD